MPPLLLLASQADEADSRPKVAAALKAMQRVVLSVQEEGAYLLVSELTKVRPIIRGGGAKDNVKRVQSQ